MRLLGIETSCDETAAAVVERDASGRGTILSNIVRSQLTERTFAHVCETGGARRTWLAGIKNVRKRYLISAAAHNLGLLMRSLFKMGTPRGLQQFKTDLEGVVSSFYLAWLAAKRFWKSLATSARLPINSAAAFRPEPDLALVA